MKRLVLVLAGCGPYSSPPPPTPPAAAPAVDAECRGASLDLRSLVQRNACVVEGEPQPLPPAIAIE